MSRLDSFIQRMLAQRDCIDHAVGMLHDVPGPILELGLGNGRTFDHLRERFLDRRIFVFDRELASHPASRPVTDHFIAGDFRDTLPRAAALIGAPAALAHCDIGSHDTAASQVLAAAIAPLLAPLMARGGIVLGDQEMNFAGWASIATPDSVKRGRYFMYRVA